MSAAPPERITSHPVVLRPFALDDAVDVLRFCGDLDLAQMTGLIPHPYLPGMAETWIASHARSRGDGTAYAWAITLSESGAVVGSIELRPSPEEIDSIGYWTGRPYWGRGYMTAAARAVVAIAFAQLDCEELHATHLVRNPASGQIMQKCGMRVLRRESRPHRGVLEEFVVWGITRAAWEKTVDSIGGQPALD